MLRQSPLLVSVLIVASATQASAETRVIGNFKVDIKKDAFGDSNNDLSIKESGGAYNLILRCEANGLEVVLRATDIGFDPGSRVRYKFDSKPTSPQQTWLESNSVRYIYAPDDVKYDIAAQLAKSTKLTIEAVISVNYNMSKIWRYNVKDFSKVKKYVDCLK